MSELTIRPLQPGETALFLSYPFQRQPELWETARDYAALLATGEYRPENTWVAIRDGIVVARACWWTGRDDENPASLDWIEAVPGPEQIDLGTRLINAAHKTMRNDKGHRPDCHLFFPPGWRETPALRVACQARLRAVQNAGLKLLVERFTYAWSAERDGMPERSDRLEFRPADDTEMLAALRQVLVGGLDAHDRLSIEENGLERAAELQLEGLYWFPSPREWWQLAFTKVGEVVGLIVPARNYAMPTIGYIGVVPQHRGYGYVNDLLAEMAWRLSELAPGEEVGADTDFANVPMVRAFARMGFRIADEHLVLTDPHNLRR